MCNKGFNNYCSENGLGYFKLSIYFLMEYIED